MSSQLFRKTVPSNFLIDFLKTNCIRDGEFYVISKVAFRMACYHDRVRPFCENLVDYYHISKQYYVQRQLDYSKFTTILRQLCKVHQLAYTSRIVYNKSSYDILYYITLPS